MPASTSEQTIRTLEIIKEEEIAAPIDVVFETILEQMGPLNVRPDGGSMSLKIEPWPGGRWYRDLGNNTGHFWGHVQAIKPPTLLEFCGPLMMSYPATSNVQYRLSEENGVTHMKFVHRAMGLFPADIAEGPQSINTGWTFFMTRIREAAENRSTAARKGR